MGISRTKHFQTVEKLITFLHEHKEMINYLYHYRDNSNNRFELEDRYGTDKVCLFVEAMCKNGVADTDDGMVFFESPYLTFFDEVLFANKDISALDVESSLKKLSEDLTLFKKATEVGSGIADYSTKIRHDIKRIVDKVTVQVVNLNYYIETEYKKPQPYELKKTILELSIEKTRNIIDLIDKTKYILSSNELLFESVNNGFQLSKVIRFSEQEFRTAHGNLLRILNKLTEFLNRVDEAAKAREKLHKLISLIDANKFLGKTNIEEYVGNDMDVVISNKPDGFDWLPDLDFLENTTDGQTILRLVRKEIDKKYMKRKKSANPLPKNCLDKKDRKPQVRRISSSSLYRAFIRGGQDLFSFVMGYDYPIKYTFEDKLDLFAEIVCLFRPSLTLTGIFQDYNNFKYQVINHAKR